MVWKFSVCQLQIRGYAYVYIILGCVSVAPIPIWELGKAQKLTQENCLLLSFCIYRLVSWLAFPSYPVCLPCNCFRIQKLEGFEIALASSHKDPKFSPRRVVVLAVSMRDASIWRAERFHCLFSFEPSTSKLRYHQTINRKISVCTQKIFNPPSTP